MAKKTTKRYFAIAVTTKDGQDLNSAKLRYALPRGAVTGAWHSKSAQKKRISADSGSWHGYKSAYGNMESLYNFFFSGEDETRRAFVVEISGRIDVDFDEEFIASENIRFIKEIQNVNVNTLREAATKYNIVTDSDLEALTEGTLVARI